MEFNQILELIDHVSASELTAFTYETADLTLSMEHGKPQIIQGVIGETVENIPAVGMTGGKDFPRKEFPRHPSTYGSQDPSVQSNLPL